MHIGIEDFLNVLYSEMPTKVDAIAFNRKRIHHGLLPVGLKIHCLEFSYIDLHFNRLFRLFDGPGKLYLPHNGYRNQEAYFCLVLPAVGNAECAIELLECTGNYIGLSLFNDPKIQIQVCSPGRLHNRYAGLLTLAFYLGSDVLRGYGLNELATTFSNNEGKPRGKRISIYDGEGALDREFAWWGRKRRLLTREKTHIRAIHSPLPMTSHRTDILTATSKVDIRNINLVATLLWHAKTGWYWENLGKHFVGEFSLLLEEHALNGHLKAQWVHSKTSTEEEDQHYLFAIQETMVYALTEEARIKRRGQKDGILVQVRDMLQRYRLELERRSQLLDEQEGEI